MLEIRHFPRFFHEMSVPEGNATCNAENKNGGLELSNESVVMQAQEKRAKLDRLSARVR